jgi:integrase
LQPEHVESFYTRLAAEGLAPRSVLRTHRVLSRALKVAVQRGRLTRNVCILVDAPSLPHTEVEPLSAAEARQVLRAARGRRNAARWSVALALGLRQGEALGVQWRDIDLVRDVLTVRRSLQRTYYRHGCGQTCRRRRAAECPRRSAGGLVFVEPKSAAGHRSIALPTPLAAALRAHRSDQDAERELAANVWEDHDLVFAQRTGRPIDPSRDYQEWKELLAAAGVRPARFHDARHTAATLLLQQGVSARVAMQILGHSQVSLTLNTYSHVVPELAREAADLMSAALWEQPTATKTAPKSGRAGSRSTTSQVARVRRQGLEPRTRGLRVRCSAS